MLRTLSAFRVQDCLPKSWPEAANAHHAAGTRRVSATPDCAYLRPNCHANPIRWPAPGFAGSSPICPARQLVSNSPTQGNFDLVKVVMTRPQEPLADVLQFVVFVHADPEVRAHMRSSRGVTELRVRFLPPNQADTGSPMSREDVAALPAWCCPRASARCWSRRWARGFAGSRCALRTRSRARRIFRRDTGDEASGRDGKACAAHHRNQVSRIRSRDAGGSLPQCAGAHPEKKRRSRPRAKTSST
jgi:hypothetical protein